MSNTGVPRSLPSIDGGRAGRETLDVAPEERRADAPDLRPWLARAVASDDDVHATGERLAAHRRGHANLELRSCASGRAGENHRCLRRRIGDEDGREERGEDDRALGEGEHDWRSGDA